MIAPIPAPSNNDVGSAITSTPGASIGTSTQQKLVKCRSGLCRASTSACVAWQALVIHRLIPDTTTEESETFTVVPIDIRSEPAPT